MVKSILSSNGGIYVILIWMLDDYSLPVISINYDLIADKLNVFNYLKKIKIDSKFGLLKYIPKVRPYSIDRNLYLYYLPHWEIENSNT